MTFFRFLSISTLSVPVLLLLGIIIGTYFYKFTETRYRFLLVYLAICFGTDVLSRIIGEIYGNNLLFILIFSLLELVFFTAFYLVCLFRRKEKKYILLTSAAVVFIIIELYLAGTSSPERFQPYSKVVGSFLILLMAISYLFEGIGKKQPDYSDMKLNSVFIIYFSLNLIFFLPLNFLINVPSSVKFYFWCFNLILTISFYVFLIREIWKNGSTRKQLQFGS